LNIISLMGWKQLPSWLKGGVIALLISVFGIVFDYIRYGLKIGYDQFIFSVLLYSFVTFPGEMIVEIFDKDPHRFFIEKILIWTFSLIIWFLIGALIGKIYGKIKSKG